MTPAINTLEKSNTEHTVHSYVHDASVQSYGLEAAEHMDIDAARIFKTLVVELNTGMLAVGIVPVLHHLNLKSIAKSTAAKKATMANPDDVVRSTGYLLGGVSPIGQKKLLPTVIDDSAQRFETIFVSAGRRGLEVELKAEHLRQLTNGHFAAISQTTITR